MRPCAHATGVRSPWQAPGAPGRAATGHRRHTSGDARPSASRPSCWAAVQARAVSGTAWSRRTSCAHRHNARAAPRARSWGSQRLAMARMARCATRVPGQGGGWTLARLRGGRVRRRRPMGGRRVLREARFQGVDALLALPKRIAPGAQRDVHSRRGVLPVLCGAGKRPAGVRARRQRFHDVSSPQTSGADGWTFASGTRRPGPEENARRAQDATRHALRLSRVATL